MEKPCKLPKIENSTSSDNDINSKTRDFISELPDDVLYSILLKLPLRESVRTRVLSHRWKHVYAFPSILELNWLNMGQNHDFLEENEHPCRNCEEKFVRGVNQYLDFYKGTCLRSFKASFCLGHGPKSDIDRWVNFAIRMGVETLSLDLYCEASRRNPTIEMFGEQLERNYVFQSSLLEGAKPNLKNLRLVACRLGRNFTNQFSFLETLTLSYSPLARYDLHTLFSYMVNLSQLILLACSLPVKLSLGSLLLLKKFCLTGGAGTKELELSNPKLLHFQCMTREAITVNLSAVPNLIKLKHSVDSTGIRYIFTHVSQNLPMLRTLTVYSRCDWVQHIPESITIFSNIQNLELALIGNTSFDILKMISILKAFPCLVSFSLVTTCSKDEEGKLQPNEYIYEHLKYVKLAGFYGTPNQIEFAKYLLKNALILERLVIKQEEAFVRKRPSWDEGERQMVIETLQEFSKEVMLIVK